jgi:predicted SPOUT superfamily RNA methylase MTH1
VENRNGLIVEAMATQADGYAEREAALLMLQKKQKGRKRRITLGADKAFDAQDFVVAAREMNVTVHVTKNDKGRRSNIDRRTTRHPGYAVSLSRRWLVEKGFGWLKQTGPMRQVRAAQRGLAVRLQLRGAQPHTAAQADRPETWGRPQGAVRLKFDRRAETAFHEAPEAA